MQQLLADLRWGEIDHRGEPALAVVLAHILDHICRAWNCKDRTPEELAALSQEEFERLSNTVPNFLGQRVLGEFALC
jgi:hypothetical protein